MFRAAAEARDGDILKMYNVRGSLVSIGPSLSANTPDTRYKLEVVAVNTTGNVVRDSLSMCMCVLSANKWL